MGAPRRHRVTALAWLLPAMLLAAACGTRVPDERFEALLAESGGDRRATTTVVRLVEGQDRPGGGAVNPPAGAASDPASQSGAGRAGGSGTAAQPGNDSGRSGGPRGARANTASDVGVTADEVRLGIIASKTGPLGPEAFFPMYHGAVAAVEWVNSHGGVNGRRLRLLWCDDAEDPARNQQCVHDLVDEQQVFAFVANSTRSYAGAGYVAEQGVPDVGGQPVGTAYWRYPTFFSIRGADYPRRGEEVGTGGRLYAQTLQFRRVREVAGITKVGVVYYNVPQSQSYADFIVNALQREGLEAVRYEVNFGFPNFGGVVAEMKAAGIDGIWDVMDATGNQNLCRAMEQQSFSVKAKVATTNGWTRTVGRTYPASCRRSLFAVSESRPNGDVNHPAVRTFREWMRRVHNGARDDVLHQWELEGWAAVVLLADGIRSMGAEVTRAGLVKWLNARTDYEAGGLLAKIDWKDKQQDSRSAGRECIVLARWDEASGNFSAVGRVPTCEDNVPYIAYRP